MEKNIIAQVKPTLRHLPPGLARSYIGPSSSAEVCACKAKTRGFIKGVCHPNGNYAQIKAAGLEWIRVDIPYPYNEAGEISESYLNFKNWISGYVQNGIRVMAVTPYPGKFIKAGIDPRIKESEPAVAEVAAFLIRDLRTLVSGFQVTNEMGIAHFTNPLTLPEAARFIGIQLKAMHPLRGNSIIGYNSAGPQADLHELMAEYLDYCDYVGIDIYIGCFMNFGGFIGLFDILLRYLWGFVKKPILLQEFGYIGAGAPKTAEEKAEILKSYGADNEQHAREDIEGFISRMPQRMQEHIARSSPDKSNWGDYVFKSDFVNHLYRELPAATVMRGYPHTPDGQAAFFRDIYPRLKKLDFVCGAFIYCYSDSKECYICSQSDCPTETRWGLVDTQGNEKPSYYAVQQALRKM